MLGKTVEALIQNKLLTQTNLIFEKSRILTENGNYNQTRFFLNNNNLTKITQLKWFCLKMELFSEFSLKIELVLSFA